MVSKLEEWAAVNGREWPCSCNQYDTVVHPEGHAYLREFRLAPHPYFTYALGGVLVEKSIRMLRGHNATVVRYKLLEAGSPVPLRLVILLAVRDYHHLTQENEVANATAQRENDWLRFDLYPGCPPLHLACQGATFEARPDWYRRLHYVRERERGLDYIEDLISPGWLGVMLRPNEVTEVVFSCEPPEQLGPARAEIIQPVRTAYRKGTLAHALAQSASDFLVRRPDGRATVVAGYHWFADWGRDTFISLPGLCLALRDWEIAKEVLRTWLEALDQGMAPNRFPEGGECPDYNSVDATLWLFYALQRYESATRDLAFITQTAYPRMLEAYDWYRNGTRFAIHMEPDGLLWAGEPCRTAG